MTATCNFCNRVFKNKQGVRAHLRHCVQYLTKKKSSPKRPPTQDEVIAEAKERGYFMPSMSAIIVEDDSNAIYSDLHPEEFARSQRIHEPRETTSKKDRTTPAKFHDYTGKKPIDREESQRIKLEEEKMEARKRRDVIQAVKSAVIDCLFWPPIPIEAKAAAKIMIEKELSSIQPLLELPRFELNQIAEGIREKIYAPYIKVHKSEKPTQKEVRTMSKTKLHSGLFQCPSCNNEFELDLAKEEELRCDCGDLLEEISDDDEDTE